MKVRITRPDGTVIEAEGTAEECERFAAPPLRIADQPVYIPTPMQVGPAVPGWEPYFYGVIPFWEPTLPTVTITCGDWSGNATTTIGGVS